MNKIEREIINSTREFATYNRLRFDGKTKLMILNAIREYDFIKRQQSNWLEEKSSWFAIGIALGMLIAVGILVNFI